jgi:hypothetical protein
MKIQKVSPREVKIGDKIYFFQEIVTVTEIRQKTKTVSLTLQKENGHTNPYTWFDGAAVKPQIAKII